MKKLLTLLEITIYRLEFYFAGILVILLPLAGLNHFRFIVFAMVPFIWIIASLRMRNLSTGLFQLYIADLGMLLFFTVAAASALWASDSSFVFNHLFGWLGLFMWMIIIRSIKDHLHKKKVDLLLFIMAVIIGLQLTYGLFFHIDPASADWNKTYGNNINFTTAMAVIMYPFILFHKGRAFCYQLIRVGYSVLLLFNIYYGSTLGSGIAMLIILFYYILVTKTLVKKRNACAFLFFLFIVAFILQQDGVLSALLEKTQNLQIEHLCNSVRIYQLKSTIKLFLSKPLFGIGLGNWFLEAYQYGVSGISPFDSPFVIIRYRNHNLFAQLLAELGIIGLGGFIYSILFVVFYFFKNIKTKKNNDHAFFIAFIIYLFLSSVYNVTNHFEHHFSSISFVAFISFGWIMPKTSKININPKVVKFVFSLISILTLFWFCYSKYTYDSYVRAKSYADLQYRWARADNPEKAIASLEQIYNPIFYTSFDIRLNIAFHLAELHVQVKNFDRAEYFYLEALNIAPYNEHLLMSYSRFLLRHSNDVFKARQYGTRAYVIQPSNYDMNLILAEIEIEDKNIKLGKEYLDKVRNSSYALWDLQVEKLDKRINDLKSDTENFIQ